MRARSPSEDEDTLVYNRHASRSPSGVLFEEMVQKLAAPLMRPGRPLRPPRILHVQATAPMVLEIPSAPQPLRTREVALPVAPTAMPSRRKARLKVPSLVFVMSLGIGFGLGHDANARSSITSQARATARAAYALVHR